MAGGGVTYHLGVDLGTTWTTAAVARGDRLEIVPLGTHGADIPSVVWVGSDGQFLVGEAAARRAVTEPDRVAREFKRRIGDPVPLIVGSSPVGAELLQGRLLGWVVAEVARLGGAPAQSVAVSHPANWGPYKLDLLRQTVQVAGLDGARFVPEPEAAALFYVSTERVDEGDVLAVYDLGGGTFDAAVVRRKDDRFEIIGEPQGLERLGGIDFDEAVFEHVRRALAGRLEQLSPEDPAAAMAVARLRDECRAAKEGLSTDTEVAIPVLLPGHQGEVRLTRGELEDMVRPALLETVNTMRLALRSAGVEPEQVSRVLLVGGSSRIPLVSELVSGELRRPVAVDVHPKHAIALGGAAAARGGLAAGPVTAVETAPEASAATAAAVTAAAAAAAAAGSSVDTGPVTPSPDTGPLPAPPPPPEPSAPGAPREPCKPLPRPVLIGGGVAAVVVIALVAALALGGGGGGGDDDATDTTPSTEAGGDGGGTVPQSGGFPLAVGGLPAGVVPADFGMVDGQGQQDTMWVSDFEGDRVLAVDVASREVRATAEDLTGPLDLNVVLPPGGGPTELWVSNSEGSSVSILDAGSMQVLADVEVGPNPYDLDAGEGVVWVTLGGTNEVAVVDQATRQVTSRVTVGEGPVDLVPGTPSWAANHDAGTATVVDPAATEPGQSVEVGEAPVSAVLVDGDLWVANYGSDTVSAVDGETFEVDTVEVGAGPVSVRNLPREGQAPAILVTNFDDDTLSVVDAATHEVVTTVPVGDGPVFSAVGENGVVWVADNLGGTVTPLDPATFAPLRPGGIEVAAGPRKIVPRPDQTEGVWVSSSGGVVSVVAADPAELDVTEIQP